MYLCLICISYKRGYRSVNIRFSSNLCHKLIWRCSFQISSLFLQKVKHSYFFPSIYAYGAKVRNFSPECFKSKSVLIANRSSEIDWSKSRIDRINSFWDIIDGKVILSSPMNEPHTCIIQESTFNWSYLKNCRSYRFGTSINRFLRVDLL